MDYKELKWNELRSFATSQGINVRGLKKVEIYNALDNFNDVGGLDYVNVSCDTKVKVVEFKGIKEEHPIFEEIKPFLPALKVYNTINGMGIKCEVTSSVEGVSKGIALLYMKHIETHKGAVVALGGCCIHKYYPRLTFGYNELAKEYNKEQI